MVRCIIIQQSLTLLTPPSPPPLNPLPTIVSLRLLVPENLMDDEASRKLKKELAEQIERQKHLAELTDPNNSLLEMKCNNGMR